jgi:transposase-like protein
MQNTREIAAEYRLRHWAGIMQERSESGKSIKSYCETVGIHQNTYHYWQRKLREAAVTATQSKTGTEIIKHKSPLLADKPTGWGMCEIQTTGKQNQNIIQIEIGKSVVKVEAGTSQELLAAVCGTLMSIC